MKKSNQAKLAAAVSAGLAVFAVGSAHAANPFTAQPLTHGYMVAEMDKAKDASCGANKAKAKAKTTSKAKSANSTKPKATAASMQQANTKKAGEGGCGAKK